MDTRFLVKDGQSVDRNYLEAMTPPQSLGPRHRPVNHFALVHTIDDLLQENGFRVTDEAFVIGRQGGRVYGVMALDTERADLSAFLPPGQAMSIAFINDNLKQVALRMAGGQITMVCENLCIGGDLTGKSRKLHTTGLDVRGVVSGLIGSLGDAQRSLSEQIVLAQSVQIPDDVARIAFCKAVEKDILPGSLLKEAAGYFFDESRPETQDRSAWAFHGALTRALRGCPLATRIQRTQALNEYLATLIDTATAQATADEQPPHPADVEAEQWSAHDEGDVGGDDIDDFDLD